MVWMEYIYICISFKYPRISPIWTVDTPITTGPPGASREKKPSATRDTRDTRDTAPAAAAAASLGTQTPKAPAPAPGRTEVAMSTTVRRHSWEDTLW